MVAISGMPGLFRIIANRPNGLVVEDIDSGKGRFFSVRKHQFTPMETVAIYTEMDSTKLSEVFITMKAKAEEMTPPSLDQSASELFDYFALILPDFDRDRVKISDIKKVIKWYHFLDSRNLFSENEEE